MLDLTQEQIELMNAGALEDVTDDVDEVAEALAAHSIMSEERHEEIIERVESCQNRLEQLSQNMSTQTESPVQSQILQELTRLQSELQTLKSSMDTMLAKLPPKESEVIIETPATPEQAPEQPRAEELIVEPARVEPEAPRKQRRYRAI